MFVEARIECKVPRYLVQDLGLDLTQGQVLMYDQHLAKSSKDLTHAVQIGAVEVTYVRISKSRRPADPTPFPPYVRRLGRHKPPTPQPPVPKPPQPSALEKELEQRFAKFEESIEGRMLSMGQRVQQALLEELRGALPNLQVSEDKVASLVETSVNKAFAQHQGSFTSSAKPVVPSSSDDAPVFIPSDLTASEKGTAHINVKSTSSKDANLDNAAAALKAARKKKTRRKKKPE